MTCARALPFQGITHLEGSHNIPMRTKSASKAAVPYIISGARAKHRLVKLREKFSKHIPVPVSSVRERLEWTRETCHRRLAAGRSSIHGWGVFARRNILSGDFVIEYIGEEISIDMANKRELAYSKSVVGIGTYMFATSERLVIDATAAGNMAQLINHSCEPNCFSRVVTCGDKQRVVISALRDIVAGEELTYDYRFSSKELLMCRCGSKTCRGTVNIKTDNDNDYEDTLV